MQLFVTNPDPIEAARYLAEVDFKRLNKQILECAQLLSTVLGGPYKPTHRHHPITKWVGKDLNTVWWTIRFMVACCDEFFKLRKKNHACLELVPEFSYRLGKLEAMSTRKLSDIPDGFCDCTGLGLDYDSIFDKYKRLLEIKRNSRGGQ